MNIVQKKPPGPPVKVDAEVDPDTKGVRAKSVNTNAAKGFPDWWFYDPLTGHREVTSKADFLLYVEQLGKTMADVKKSAGVMIATQSLEAELISEEDFGWLRDL